jgi:hypothetical protein
MSKRIGFIFGFISLVLAACGGSAGEVPDTIAMFGADAGAQTVTGNNACVPNSTTECGCSGAKKGIQTCVVTGDAYTPCDCTPAPAAAPSPVPAPVVDSGSTAPVVIASAPSDAVCVQNRQVACTCSTEIGRAHV